MNKTKKLTVIKTTYGSNNYPVIQLIFNNGGTMPTAEIVNEKVPLEIINMIARVSQAGYVIDYQGFED